jgi:hypothetical protein
VSAALRRRLYRWLDESIAGDWLRHQFGLACHQQVSGHEYVRPEHEAWGGMTDCIWLAHPQANRCFRPARCHETAEATPADAPVCKICNDTGMVQCAEQDGTGVYEQACPEPVHDGEPVDWEPCEHDHGDDCYDDLEELNCYHEHCSNCGGCNCPGYCDDYQTYNLRPEETGGAA